MIYYNTEKLISLVPNEGKTFHIIGIGGIGMSAIAHILHNHGAYIQGSDLANSENIEKLKAVGIKCFIGHAADNIQNADIIIYSSAIKSENIEMQTARAQNKIILNRAEILNQMIYASYNICISGMHGKTTTSSMIALILEHAKIKQLAMIGGVMQYNQANFIIHKDFKWTVIEADESDDTFIRIPRTIPIVTNISPEHLDYHLTFENIKNKFLQFIEQIPFYGFAILCVDDEQVEEIANKVNHNRLITYSVNKPATYSAQNIIVEKVNKINFDVYVRGKLLDTFTLNIFGKFNVSNALAAIAVAHELNIDLTNIKAALSDFRSTKRRFEILGKFCDAIVIDDYAHHPREIDVNIETALILAKQQNSKLFVIFQPHRYTRLQKLLDSFASSKLLEADHLILLPVYSAGENEIQGANSAILLKKLIAYKLNKNASVEIDYEAMKTELKKSVQANDIILFLGAGDVTKYAHDLANENYSSSL